MNAAVMLAALNRYALPTVYLADAPQARETGYLTGKIINFNAIELIKMDTTHKD
jgi:hypothetical protein